MKEYLTIETHRASGAGGQHINKTVIERKPELFPKH